MFEIARVCYSKWKKKARTLSSFAFHLPATYQLLPRSSNPSMMTRSFVPQHSLQSVHRVHKSGCINGKLAVIREQLANYLQTPVYGIVHGGITRITNTLNTIYDKI